MLILIIPLLFFPALFSAVFAVYALIRFFIEKRRASLTPDLFPKDNPRRMLKAAGVALLIFAALVGSMILASLQLEQALQYM